MNTPKNDTCVIFPRNYGSMALNRCAMPKVSRPALTPEQLEDPCPRCGHKLWLHTPACVGSRPQGAIRPGPMDSVPCPCEGP